MEINNIEIIKKIGAQVKGQLWTPFSFAVLCALHLFYVEPRLNTPQVKLGTFFHILTYRIQSIEKEKRG